MAQPTLRLLTYNTGLFRFQLFGKSVFEPAPFVEERFRHLAPALLGTGADIIALQEIYDLGQQQQLASDLATAYPHQAVWSERHLKRLCSGLMLFSKYPLREARGHRFYRLPWDERVFVDKGMLTASIEAGAFGRINLANCHHTSGGALWDPEGWFTGRFRNHQYRQVFGALRSKSTPLNIALGDFNCGPKTSAENYRQLTSYGFADAWSLRHGDYHESTWDPANPLNAKGPHWNQKAERLDHVLLNEDILAATRVVGARIVFNEPNIPIAGDRLVTASDHYGLMVDLEKA